jgi:hypothetical protein
MNKVLTAALAFALGVAASNLPKRNRQPVSSVYIRDNV